MKKIVLCLMLILGVFVTSISVYADDMPLVLANGNKVYYSGTEIEVTIPDTYVKQDTYFRGAWVTPLAGSIPSYQNEEQYKKEIIEMFDVLDYFNINALIFHVRIFNDALYPSELNGTSSYLNANWDVLAWVIEECHNRGIEFHAWLNPYRVRVSGEGTLEDVASSILDKNIGSDPNNLLMSDTGAVILNPGLPVVRDFIIDTVLEIMNNYDVDAIHFDDYFYIANVDDSATYNANNPNNLGLADWRREQVNLFIEKLSQTMKDFNRENNRFVQLGISPTGIYRNGDGVVTYDEAGNAISSGSKTGGQEHYASYLYSDTLKWINEEWIDYITPQSYWAFSQPIAGYADVMSWWDKVVKYKKVNLYSGMGIYMSENPGSNYSWGYDPDESVNQILYASTLENVKGTVFYSYNYLEYTYKGDRSSLYGKGLTKIQSEMFTNPAILPSIPSMSSETSEITTFEVVEKDGGAELSIAQSSKSKFYVIYRSEKNIDFSEEQVYDIISGDSLVLYQDNNTNGKVYNYGVKSLSHANYLSEGKVVNLNKYTVVFQDNNGNVLSEQELNYGEDATPPTLPDKDGMKAIGWSRDYTNVTKDLVITPKYQDSEFIVSFYNDDGTLIKEEKVGYLGSATAPVAVKEGFVFDKWDKDYTNVSKDIDVYPIYQTKYCNITITDFDGKELLSYQLKYGKKGWFPEEPTRSGYQFTGWSNNLEFVTDDIVVTALYEPIVVIITFINNLDQSVIEVIEAPQFTDVTPPAPPKVQGFKFMYWIGTYENVQYNGTVKAMYSEIYFEITLLDYEGKVFDVVDFFYLDGLNLPDLPDTDVYEFLGWDIDIDNLPFDTEELIIKPLYNKKTSITTISITFTGFNDSVIETITITKGEDFEYPIPPEIEGYDFFEWDNKELSEELLEYTVKAIYKIKEYTVTYTGLNGKKVYEEKVSYGADATFNFTIPEEEGYVFESYSSDGKKITEDTTIIINYSKEKGCKSQSVFDIGKILSFAALASILLRKKK